MCCWGREDLFRTTLALTWDIGETWALQGIYEHLSHGQILGEGRNQGLDEIGMRAGVEVQVMTARPRACCACAWPAVWPGGGRHARRAEEEHADAHRCAAAA